MTRTTRPIALAVGALVFAAQALAQPLPSLDRGILSDDSGVRKAQIKLIIGTSDRRVRRSMRDAGYSDIEIKHRGLTKAIAEGCKNGRRFRVELRPSGRINNAERIGRCRSEVSPEQVRQILRDKGFRKIDIDEQGNIPYVATACRKGGRFGIRINRYGDVTVGRRVGECGRRLTKAEIRDQLRADNYNRIKFVDQGRRRVRVEACRQQNRYRIVMSPRGEIRDRNRIGRCAPPVTPARLAAHVESKGYDRVEVIDAKLPRYAVEACKGRDRLELVMNRFGDIRREIKVGRCPPPINEESLRQLMSRAGFKNVRLVSTNKDEYATIACKDNDRMSIRFSRYGEVIDQERVGTCRSPRIIDMLETLDGRGVNRMTVHIDGCRRGNRIRFTLNEWGEILRREQIGRCLRRR